MSTRAAPSEEAAALRATTARIIRAGDHLRDLPRDHIADVIAKALHHIADPHTELGRHARRTLPDSTGHSPQMISWALTELARAGEARALRKLGALLDGAGDTQVLSSMKLAVVVLAGNVFTASAQALALPLLARTPVIAKAPVLDDAFPRLFHRALGEIGGPVSGAVDVTTFAGGDEELEAVLLAEADVVSVFGSDATIVSIRARARASTQIVAHGHGIGLLYLPAGSLRQDPRAIAESAALDVAAYDQRGCMSPHAVLVSPDAGESGAAFAKMLSESLASLSRTLPRGPLPPELGGAQAQWRGVASVRGLLNEGDGWSVSEEGAEPLRPSPGYRNVSVIDGVDEADLVARLGPLGAHLKALGVGGDAADRLRIARALPRGVAPRVCAIGEMQRPPIHGLADGVEPFAGMRRLIQVE